MYADTADYSEWKNGRRATGLVRISGSDVAKNGAPLVLRGRLILASYGYQANVEQTEQHKTAYV